MSDQPKPTTGLRDYHDVPFPEGTQPTTGEWTMCPVLHGDGSEWEGLRYVVDPSGRKHGSMNEQVAVGLVQAINAALSAERENLIIVSRTIGELRQQLEEEVKQQWLARLEAYQRTLSPTPPDQSRSGESCHPGQTRHK